MISFVVFKQKTAYEMRISDWSSDVCSSDLLDERGGRGDVRPFERAGDDPRLGIVGQDAAVPYPEQAVQPLDDVRPGGTGDAEAIDLLRIFGIAAGGNDPDPADRKSTRLNSSH